MRGWRSRKRAVIIGDSGSEVGIAPIRNVPSNPPRSRLASCLSDSRSASARCAQPRISSPSGVSASNSRPRRTSDTPSSRSRLRIPADSVGCDTWQATAARPKWRSRSSAARYSSWRMNTVRPMIDRVYESIGASSWTIVAFDATVRAVSRNLVELVRRHHEQGAPTALEVLKEAMDQRGEITDDDRRVAAERSGLPEAAVHGVSTFYDDLIAPRGERHVRVCTGTACFAATADTHVETVQQHLGLKLGERAADKSVSLAETVCLGYCHASPAVRDGDTIDAGPGAIERLLAGATTPAPEPVFASLLELPVLTRPGDWSGYERALQGTPEDLLQKVKAADVKGRGGAGFPARGNGEFA